MNLSNLAGPIIGAMIGYGTNWLAIKMLFRPVKPIKIGKLTLPFTPGMIPKRKEKLAVAMGEMVGKNLFTRQDMQTILLSEEVQNSVVDKIKEILNTEDSIKDLLLNLMNEEQYEARREDLKMFISQKVKDGLLEAGLGEMIATEGGRVVREKVSGSMLKMFVTDGLIQSIVEPVGSQVEMYIKEHGEERIVPVVENQIALLEGKSVKDCLSDFEINDAKIREIYQKLISNFVTNWLDNLDIAGTVERKIKDMDVLDLEKLILQVMKKELGAIVNLGALLGFLLGCVMLCFA